jgi:hypothetical protein
MAPAKERVALSPRYVAGPLHNLSMYQQVDTVGKPFWEIYQE